MTQVQTWKMHFAIALAVTLISLTIGGRLGSPQIGAALGAWTVVVWFTSREVRDHEVREKIPAKRFYEGFAFWRWSTDGKMDLISAIAGASIPVWFAFL